MPQEAASVCRPLTRRDTSIVAVLWSGDIVVHAETLRDIILRFQQTMGIDCFELVEFLRTKGDILDQPHEKTIMYGAICQNVKLFFRERTEQPAARLRACFSIPACVWGDFAQRRIQLFYPEPKNRCTCITIDLEDCRVHVVPPETSAAEVRA